MPWASQKRKPGPSAPAGQRRDPAHAACPSATDLRRWPANTTAHRQHVDGRQAEAVQKQPRAAPPAKICPSPNEWSSRGHAATIATASAHHVKGCCKGWPSRPVEPAATMWRPCPATRMTVLRQNDGNESPSLAFLLFFSFFPLFFFFVRCVLREMRVMYRRLPQHWSFSCRHGRHMVRRGLNRPAGHPLQHALTWCALAVQWWPRGRAMTIRLELGQSWRVARLSACF